MIIQKVAQQPLTRAGLSSPSKADSVSEHFLPGSAPAEIYGHSLGAVDRSEASLSTRVEESLKKGVSNLLNRQQEDGSWSALNDLGHHQSAQRAILYQKLGRLSEADAEQSLKFLLSRQLEDGSWPPYPHAEKGDLDATAIAYAGMKVCGVSDDAPELKAAERWIDEHGGLDKTRIDMKLFLVAADLLPADSVPSMPKFMRLIPGLDRLIGKKLAMQTQVVMNGMMPTASLIKRDFQPLKPWQKLQEASHDKYAEALTETQNPNGNWMGSTLHTLFGATGLLAAGIPADDPRVEKAFAFVDSRIKATEEGNMTSPFSSEVWDTACSVQALIEAGVEASDPRLKKAVDYLESQQAQLPSPRSWQNPQKGAPRTGGWAFMADNPLAPDTDTAGVVLSALAVTGNQEQAFEQGQEWLKGMQLSDGGWATWTAQSTRPNLPGPDRPTLPLVITKIPAFQRLNPILDDTSADGLTGRILSTLGHSGHTVEDPEVKKAVEFLKSQRDENGIWWGRWGVNYVAGTSYVLSGLAAVGQDMQEPWIRKAVDWLKSVQQEDGGWGEAPVSYETSEAGFETETTPPLGRGEKSLPTATSTTLMALIEAGEGESESVRRGVEYLMKAQDAEGGWSDQAVQGVGEPFLKFFYENDMFPEYWSVQALARYKNKVLDKA